MKNIYSLQVQLRVLIFLCLQGFLFSAAQSQSVGNASVEAIEHFIDNNLLPRKIPLQHVTAGTFSQNEKHILNTLTPTERKGIEDAVDPPAIGVVRDLKDPIQFTLNVTDIPEPGSQKTVSGGILARFTEDSLVWSTYIRSESAEELRIFFSGGNFPAGVQVNLFSKDGYAFNQTELQGKVNENGFYTTTTFADYVYLEVVIPVNVLTENVYFTIPRVVHANNRLLPDAPNVDCYEDVNCAYANGFASIGALKAATSQLRFVDGGFYYICSGTLLNDIRAVDYQPFLLTANHCFSTQASAASLEAKFDLYTTSCNGATNTSVILINGSNLLATNSQSDFTLVLLNDNPGGYRYYLGWTAGGVANDATVHSVNHPAGMPQKYQRALNKTSPTFSCGGLSTSNFHYTRALGGESVGGSSGGNLVDAGGVVIGQLYGWCHLTGVTECDYPNFYNVWGKFEVSYNNNNLAYWLYNGGSSVSMATSPAASLSYSQLNVGSYQDLAITVYNNGTAPNYLNLEAGNAYITGTDASQFSIVGTPYLYLEPNTSGTIWVRFTPSSSGLKTASFNLPHNANNTVTPRVISLSGTAEPCSNVIALNNGGAANAKTYSKSGSGIWYTSWTTPCGYSCPGNEQIYSFVAPYTGYYSVNVSAANGYFIDYMWRPADCSGGVWNCIQDIASVGTFGSVYWTAGSTYYILADAESTVLTTQTFAIILNPCLNTTPIAGTGAANSATYSNTGNGAWNTYSPAPCNYTCPGMEQIYTFVAPYTGYYSIEVTDASSWVDYMWSTSCGSTGWNCIQDVYWPGSYGSMYWTAGTTYYILLDGELTGAGPHTFYINDPNPCIGITPLACNQAVEFPGGGPGVWNNYTCYYSTPGVEKIYSFVAPATGQYSIQVNAAGNWVDYMWSTSCSPASWTCIQDVYNPGQYGSMSWTAGTTYYILLDDEDNLPGIHSFSIVCPELCHACPTYDFNIYPEISWLTSSSSIDASGCKNYRFYAYTGYHYTFKTGCGDGAGADYDTFLQLYDAACTLVTYNDDGCGYPLSKIEWTPATSGYYTLKVMGYSSNFGNYTLAYNLCAAAPEQPGSITGPATVVSGVPQTYTISDVPGATSYTWTYSGTGTVTGSGTSGTLTATGNGLLSVMANNLCGTSIESATYINVVPLNLNIQNVLAIPGSPVCYPAGQTITLAGGGTVFIMPLGSSVELVAGQNILFYPGVQVQNGAYLLGRISTDGTYCPPLAKFAEITGDGNNGNAIPAITSGDAFFKVFPNPTTGNFTLELSSEPEGTVVKVLCYNLLGGLIMEKEFTSGKLHELTLIDQKPGLYMLKVVQNESTGMQKIIRQ